MTFKMILLFVIFIVNDIILGFRLKFKLLEKKMEQSGDINPTTEPIHANQKVWISRLINSVYFSIETCFIFGYQR
jgi:hypothetical protein